MYGMFYVKVAEGLKSLLYTTFSNKPAPFVRILLHLLLPNMSYSIDNVKQQQFSSQNKLCK